MKKLLTLLLIVSSVITINAQRTKSQAQITPTHVKALFSDIIKNWGSPSDEVFSVNRNPNTNLIESSRQCPVCNCRQEVAEPQRHQRGIQDRRADILSAAKSVTWQQRVLLAEGS